MIQIILKQERYNYGRCNCCNKRFNRSTRGRVLGFSEAGDYYQPEEYHEGDTGKAFTFNVPDGVEIKFVKVGWSCAQKLNVIEWEPMQQPSLSDCKIGVVAGGKFFKKGESITAHMMEQQKKEEANHE